MPGTSDDERKTFWTTIGYIEADTNAYVKAMSKASSLLKSMNITSKPTVGEINSGVDLTRYIYEKTSKPYSSLSARKHITHVEVRQKNEWIDVTTIGDPAPQLIPGIVSYEFFDQDGDPLDPKLHRRFLEELQMGRFEQDTVNRILREWNDGDESHSPEPVTASWAQGHKKHCAYRNNSDFPCVCHPPTLFHESMKLWYCDCCERPRAILRYGLCEMCSEHQYSDPRHVDIEHLSALEE